MDAEGHKLIAAAVEGLNTPVNVEPQPEGDENVRYVSIKTLRHIAPALVLNALDEAGLIDSPIARNMMPASRPNLRLLGLQTGSATFEDRSV